MFAINGRFIDNDNFIFTNALEVRVILLKIHKRISCKYIWVDAGVVGATVTVGAGVFTGGTQVAKILSLHP